MVPELYLLLVKHDRFVDAKPNLKNPCFSG